MIKQYKYDFDGALFSYSIIVLMYVLDIGGRYSYKNQPEICKWNCEKLADVLQLFTNMSDLKVHLDTFHAEFKKKYLEIMRRKVTDSYEHVRI